MDECKIGRKEITLFSSVIQSKRAKKSDILETQNRFLPALKEIAKQIFGDEVQLTVEGSVAQRTALKSSDMDILVGDNVQVTRKQRQEFLEAIGNHSLFKRASIKCKTNAISISDPEIDIAFAYTTWCEKRYRGDKWFYNKHATREALIALKCWNKVHGRREVDGFAFKALIRDVYEAIEERRYLNGLYVFVRCLERIKTMEMDVTVFPVEQKIFTRIKKRADIMLKQFEARPQLGFEDEQDIERWLKEDFHPPSRQDYGECKPCGIKYESKTVAIQHEGSTKHKRMVSPHTFAGSPTSMKSPKLGTTEFSCKICNIPLNSKEQMDVHLSGKKHKKKVGQISGMAQPQNNQSPARTNVVSPSLHQKSGFIEQKCDICIIRFQTETQKLEHYRSVRHKNKEFKASPNSRCGLCSTIFDTEEQRQIHIQSKKHKNKLVRRCEKCNKNCNSESQFQAHLQSKQHIAKN